MRSALFCLSALLGLVLAGLSSCEYQPESIATPALLRPEWATGQFGELFVPPFSVRLDAQGWYHCEVWSGMMTPDGCGGPFLGDGDSKGRWHELNGKIVFKPEHETDGLRLSLVRATAVKVPGGLSMEVGGQTYLLPRSEEIEGILLPGYR